MTDDLKRAMEALEENMREHAEQRVVAPVYNKCCRFTRNHGATILAALREREQAIDQARADEREACAEAVERCCYDWEDEAAACEALETAAAAIRARGAR